jgi:putative peptidoglycan lipid II flippase
VYYAKGDFRTPVRVSIAMLFLNTTLNLVLVLGAGMDVDGLALATAITSWGNALVLWPGLASKLGLPPTRADLLPRLARIAVASAACGASAWGVMRALDGVGSVWIVVAGSAAGALAYFVVAAAVGVGEARRVLARVVGRR